MIVDVVDDCLACMVVYINMVDVESLTGPVAIERAVNVSLEAVESAGLTTTLAHFKLSSQGITITDSKHRSLRRIVLFLRIPIPDPVYHHAWVLFLGSKHVRLSICCCPSIGPSVRPSKYLHTTYSPPVNLLICARYYAQLLSYTHSTVD